MAILGPMFASSFVILQYNLFPGPDFLVLRLAMLPVLFTSAAPLFTTRGTSTETWKRSNVNHDCVDDFLELLYRLSFPIFYGGWSFILLTYSTSFDAMAYGFGSATLAALVYLGCHLYLFRAMDEELRDEFWIDLEWVLFRWVVFLGLVVGTYADGKVRSFLLEFGGAISPDTSFIFQASKILVSAYGLVAASAFLRRLKNDHTTNRAILDAMRKDPKIFIIVCAFTVVWAICNIALFSGLWYPILASRIFGSAFVTMWTGMISWPSTRRTGETGRDVRASAVSHRDPPCKENRLSLQIVFAVYWAAVATAAVASLLRLDAELWSDA